MSDATAAIDAVRSTADNLQESGFEISRLEDGFDMESGFGPTMVRVRSIPEDEAGENGVAAVITVETVLPDAMGDFDDDAIATLNTLATLSTIVQREDGRYVTASRVSVFAGYEEELTVQIPLITAAAILQAEHVHRVITDASTDETVEFPPFTEGEDEARWNAEDFSRMAEWFREAGAFSNGGEGGLTAELPWAEGAVSSSLGHRTALVQMQPADHPLWGLGLMFVLRHPDLPPEEYRGELCTAMNRGDLDEAGGPPLLGSWCIEPDGGLAFIGFLPNLFHDPQLTEFVGSWLIGRSQWAYSVTQS
jgi:hypothetical protein